ncbi:MAG: diacylglycerol kinase [Actinomycetota bacterium]|nr:diacylglycerol kinase [Actinomycetota bacterium]
MDASSSPARFDRILLIYNPVSSRNPAQLAERLRGQVTRRVPDVPVRLQPSEFPGHARELARAAAAVGRPLIVSVSGDGGYNEVVNGVMDVEQTEAVSAVLASGNANDHHRSTPRPPLIEAIVRGEVRRIDLLRLTQGEGGAAWTHYAHSYIGLGLTPAMAIGIEEGNKGALKELVSVTRTLRRLQPFEIIRDDGARAVFDSLILANVPAIAKYGKISETGDPDDGLFEVIMSPPASKWRMALMTLRAVTVGLGIQPRVSRYSFRTLESVPLQMDGEVMTLKARAPVVVVSAHRALATLGRRTEPEGSPTRRENV